jgi:hypothetical protein
VFSPFTPLESPAFLPAGREGAVKALPFLTGVTVSIFRGKVKKNVFIIDPMCLVPFVIF